MALEIQAVFGHFVEILKSLFERPLRGDACFGRQLRSFSRDFIALKDTLEGDEAFHLATIFVLQVLMAAGSFREVVHLETLCRPLRTARFLNRPSSLKRRVDARGFGS